MVQTLSRRDRVRAATTEEIKLTARRILVEDGPDAVSLRAIARSMGMTAPALYRYFGSHEELIKHVVADIFTGLTSDLNAAIAAAGAETGGDLTAKVIAAAREFRRWSLDHPREFGMLFTFLRCWVRLYGIVSLEVFGHLGFALDDAEPMFELMLAETAPLLGLQFPAPS
jgi:AcrR family transcriptional regulator